MTPESVVVIVNLAEREFKQWKHNKEDLKDLLRFDTCVILYLCDSDSLLYFEFCSARFELFFCSHRLAAPQQQLKRCIELAMHNNPDHQLKIRSSIEMVIVLFKFLCTMNRE